MKIVTTAEAFLSALKLSLKPEKKAAIPILSNVLLTGTQITSTDLDMWSFLDFKGKVTKGKKESDKFILPYFAALDVLIGETGELTIETMNNNYVKLTVSGCEYKLASLSTSNFPAAPAVPASTLTVDGKVFRTMLDRVMFAISREQSRYTLNGMLIKTTGESLKMVGTDGHRLSMAEHPNEGGKIPDIIIPTAALEYVKSRIGESISIGVEDAKDGSAAWVGFRLDGVTFVTRKLTGQFPNYEAVMPRKSPITATIPSAKALLSILTRVAKCADERSGAVKFTFGDKPLLYATSSERGTATAPFDAPTKGDNITIGLNSAYVLEFLKKAGDIEVKVSLTNPQSAILFSIWGWQYCAMPMRM